MAADWNSSVKVQNPNRYLTDGFVNEKEMTEYIDKFARYFAKDVLEINYMSHTKEYYLGDTVRILKGYGGLPHVDFLFESCEGQKILVECKNPKSTYAELSNAIGQILSYYCISKEQSIKIDRICIITSKFDERISLVIKEFNLPIEIYLLSKNNILKLMN